MLARLSSVESEWPLCTLRPLNVVYKDCFIPLADPEETLHVVCVIWELMT
jgi:hypothetical protein